MRKLIPLALIALAASAETVYFTPTSKTYCTNPHCLTLSRAKTVLHADRAEAEAHGLKQSGADKKPHGATGKTKAAAKNDWAR